ncbi:hypothetical protein CC80DRAFT_493169 [Byssothecium circinans]|uniref:F-box domain-containing protein n=1 Tax=Byssothecium circinans TaxID=147558 RepID=A0A6A5TU10_9PLEO|nr:hypothetical protein CC80DRAFT_493169 [Byssothecium circinans]
MASFPAVPTIPKDISRKAYPTKASFLDLPAEIRNMVYSLVLGPPSEITVDTRDYHSFSPFTLEALRLKTAPWERSANNPIFQICRQLYHETTSLFYGQSTFVITRLYTCANHRLEEDQAGLAAKWMSGLGSQVAMLKKVIIDLDRTCDWPCCAESSPGAGNFEHGVDVFGLLKLLWANSDAQIDIRFCHSRGPSHLRRGYYLHRGLRTRTLATVLTTLAEDELGVKKYWRTIKALYILRNGTQGAVLFDTTRQPSGPRWSHDASHWLFDITANGDTVEFCASSPPLGLRNLPSNALSRIIHHVNTAPDHASVDLTEKTIDGADPVLTSVSQLTRRDSETAYLKNNFDVKMTSTDPTTLFSSFDTLRKWLCRSRSATWPFDIGHPNFVKREKRGEWRFHLNFALAGSNTTSLIDVGVGLVGFIAVTSHVYWDCAISFTLTTRAPDGSPQYAEHSISLSVLRLRVLVALTEYAIQYPGSRRLQCPEVYMNGLGVITLVSDHQTRHLSSQTLASIFQDNDKSELMEMYAAEPGKNGRDDTTYSLDPILYHDGSLRVYTGFLGHVVADELEGEETLDYWAKRCKWYAAADV